MTAQFPSTVRANSVAGPDADCVASSCLEQAIRAVRGAAQRSNAPYFHPDIGPRVVRPGLGYVGWSFWGDRAARWLLIRVRGDVAVLTLKETRECRATFFLEFAPPVAADGVLAGAWNWLVRHDLSDRRLGPPQCAPRRSPSSRPVLESLDATTSSPVAAPPLRILVVDDHHDLAWSLALALQAYGHDARHAVDGRAALALAAWFRPDVVLLDLALPVIDGFEIARRLRARPETSGARYWSMTGLDVGDARVHSAASAFEAHLRKPIDVASLNALLRGPRPATRVASQP